MPRRPFAFARLPEARGGDELVAVQVMPQAMQELLIASVAVTGGSE